jgi:hypothetical protein
MALKDLEPECELEKPPIRRLVNRAHKWHVGKTRPRLVCDFHAVKESIGTADYEL